MMSVLPLVLNESTRTVFVFPSLLACIHSNILCLPWTRIVSVYTCSMYNLGVSVMEPRFR